jgi:hypothetical protein
VRLLKHWPQLPSQLQADLLPMASEQADHSVRATHSKRKLEP